MVKPLKFVTTNMGKFRSAQKYFANNGVEIEQLSLDLPEIRKDDIHKIAIHKALFAYKEIKQPVIVHDTGFYIEALNGYPGFCVGYTLDKIGINGLLKLISEPSKASFKSYLAYMDNSLSEPILFEDTYNGTLQNKVSGEKQLFFWSDLFLAFTPNGRKKTLAEHTEQEFRALEKSLDTTSCFCKFASWYRKEKK